MALGAPRPSSCPPPAGKLGSVKTLDPGSEIAGYLLEEVLGRGGMGVVWRAKQIALDRPVALKLLAQELAEDVDFRGRFELEAKLAARIRHPNVVIVHDAREEDGVLILAMELVPGVDLANILRAQGPFPTRRALDITGQVAAALDAAHAHDLVHRDVKPANVLVASDRDGEHAYLTDFGLTKALTRAASEGLTKPGTMLGTPDYMAPEQVRGEPVDARADVYALGCILFELLAGAPPYRRDTEVATWFAQVNDPVPSLCNSVTELPPALDDVVARALAKAPQDRFSSAGELIDAAHAAVDDVPALRQQRTVISIDDGPWEGHAVVAGVGASGSKLAVGLDDAGYRVVVIERDGASDGIPSLRERGVPVLVGDATDPEMLNRARVTHARQLIVTCGNDARNLEIATVAEKQLEADSSGVLTAFVHLGDLGLLRAMKAETVRGGGRGGFRLEFFNAYATGARLLLDRHPAFERPDGSPVPSPQICIVGHNAIASNVVLALAAEWQRVRPSLDALPIIVTGPQASELVDRLLAEFPHLADMCSLDARPARVQAVEFQTGNVLLGPSGQCTITKAYVALDDESVALQAALGLHGQPATESVPVVVAFDDDTAPASTVLRASSRAFTRSVEPFGVLSSALAPTLLMRGVNELLARANHQVYLEEQRARGISDGPSMVSWDALPESLKNSNRRFADGIGAALEAVGCTVVPAALAGADIPPVTFVANELEQLAVREHERWMTDLIRDGWRFREGEKDPEQKLHPMLVPWAELDEGEREKDRDAVRAIPQALARAGFEVIRTQPRASGAPPVGAATREGN